MGWFGDDKFDADEVNYPSESEFKKVRGKILNYPCFECDASAEEGLYPDPSGICFICKKCGWSCEADLVYLDALGYSPQLVDD